MLTLTAFIANAQPSAIAPRDYQQMLKKGIDVDWWGRSEKNKYGPIRKLSMLHFSKRLFAAKLHFSKRLSRRIQHFSAYFIIYVYRAREVDTENNF